MNTSGRSFRIYRIRPVLLSLVSIAGGEWDGWEESDEVLDLATFSEASNLETAVAHDRSDARAWHN